MNLIRPVVQNLEKICRGNSVLFNLYAWPYKKTVQREIRLGSITQEDKVLNIGCGALPFTSYHINRLTGASIIAVDLDNEAVIEAKNLLSKLKISEEEIFLVNLAALEAIEKFDFTKVVAALQTEGKKEILKAIEKKARRERNDIQFIVREPRSGFTNQYDNISLEKLSNQKINQAKQKFPTFDRSISIKLGAN